MSSFLDIILAVKHQINSQFFMETIVMICWAIWTARNELIFRENGTCGDEYIRTFFKELKLKQDQQPQCDSWFRHLELLAA